MSLDDWYLVFFSVCFAVVIIACVPIVMAYMPSRSEPFFALAVLGEEGMADHYYPGDDPSIMVKQDVNWTIHLYNHMGETQYVAVRMKLLNSTMLSPNSTLCVPSPAPVVYEIRRILRNNETWLYPFSWAILNVERAGDFLGVKSLSVNGEVISTNAAALYGFNYRLVLELWVYDEKLGGFQFGYGYADKVHCAWNQVWFNVTSPA